MKRLIAAMIMMLMIFFNTSLQADEYFLDQRKDIKETPLLFKEFSDGHGNVAPYVYLGTSVVDLQTFGTVEGVLRTQRWNSFTNSNYIVHTIVSGTFALHGTGFVIKGGKILTAAHVVEPETATAQLDVHSSQSIWPIRVLERLIVIGGGHITAKIIWIDKDNDIALLEPVGNCPGLKPLPYDLEMFGIHANDPLIATIVRTRDEDGNFNLTYEVRFGTIRSLLPEFPDDFPKHFIPWFSMNDITITTKLIPGDSGSPIFGFKNGRPVIIGIGRARIPRLGDVYAYMAGLDQIYMIANATNYWGQK